MGGPFASRPYQGESDLRQMREFLMEARRRTGDWRYPHVGELMWQFFMVACHLDPAEHIRLWQDDAGRVVGYALLGEDPSFDCWVGPEGEGQGIEADALAWAEGRLAGLRRRDPRRWSGPLVSGARRDDTRRLGFLEAHGFHYRGEFSEVNLLRSLEEPVAEPLPPPGYRVRGLGGTGEIPSRALAQREVWRPWTVGNVTDDDYAALTRLPGYRRELDVVAVAPDGVIAAYAHCWLDPVNRIGDLGPVGARPAYRRQGLARAVLLEGLRRMQAAGMERACVSTGVSNPAARSLYESVGFRVVNEYLDYARPAARAPRPGVGLVRPRV